MKRDFSNDYIGIVRKKNGSYIIEWRDTDVDKDIIRDMMTFAKDDNKTIIDMQVRFDKYFASHPKRPYNCVLPHAFNLSFVCSAEYPDFISEAQYENECTKVAESVDEKDVKKALREYNNEIKDKFLQQATRYIRASAYDLNEKQIKNERGVVLSSYETLGWRHWSYSPSEDVTLVLNTNLGMGPSSYIALDIKYKGRVLPAYSPLVRYYNVDIDAICMNTRVYTPSRDNWNEVLSFVCDTCGCAERDSHGFVYEWVQSEVEVLKAGIASIAADPNKLSHPSTNGLYGVDNALQNDYDMYERYPIESARLFYVRKVVAALQFVDSLREWSDIYPPAAELACYIKQLNQELAPQLLEEIATQHRKVDRLNERLMPLTDQWQDIEVCIDKNPENTEMLIFKGRLDERIDTLLKEIVTCNDYIKSMQRSYARITKSGILYLQSMT